MVFGAVALVASAATGRVRVAVFATVGLALTAYLINSISILNDTVEGVAAFTPFDYYLTGDRRSLASGVHALARLLTWTGARFELRPEVEVTGEAEPMPVTSALVGVTFMGVGVSLPKTTLMSGWKFVPRIVTRVGTMVEATSGEKPVMSGMIFTNSKLTGAEVSPFRRVTSTFTKPGSWGPTVTSALVAVTPVGAGLWLPKTTLIPGSKLVP